MNSKEKLIQILDSVRYGLDNLRCDKCIHYVEEGHQCWCPDTTVSYAPADFFCKYWESKE
jgi:hypothetical protein